MLSNAILVDGGSAGPLGMLGFLLTITLKAYGDEKDRHDRHIKGLEGVNHSLTEAVTRYRVMLESYDEYDDDGPEDDTDLDLNYEDEYWEEPDSDDDNEPRGRILEL